ACLAARGPGRRAAGPVAPKGGEGPAVPPPQRSRGRRPGLSLLEVLIALAIFLVAFVGLGQLIIRGGDAAMEIRLQSEAAQLGQTKLAEVYAGAEPLTAQHDMPFEEAPSWRWDL